MQASEAAQELRHRRSEPPEIHQEGVVALRRFQRQELRLRPAGRQPFRDLLLLLPVVLLQTERRLRDGLHFELATDTVRGRLLQIVHAHLSGQLLLLLLDLLLLLQERQIGQLLLLLLQEELLLLLLVLLQLSLIQEDLLHTVGRGGRRRRG